MYPKEAESVYFKEYLFIWLQWVLVVDHGIFIASHRTFHRGMGALEYAASVFAVPGFSCSVSCGILSPHAISEAPEAKAEVCPAFMKDWTRVLFVARQILNLEFLWPPECPVKSQWFERVTCICITNICLSTTIICCRNNLNVCWQTSQLQKRVCDRLLR